MPNSSSVGASTGNALGSPSALAVENARKMSPEKWLTRRSGPGKPERDPTGQRLALSRQQRRVGRDDGDDRPGARRRPQAEIGGNQSVSIGLSVGQRGPPAPRDRELLAGTEVGLHERADRVSRPGRSPPAATRCRCRP